MPFLRCLLLALLAVTASAAEPPRVALLTIGGEFDPTPDVRTAAAPWADRLAVTVYPSGATPEDLTTAAFVLVDASTDLTDGAQSALARAAAAGRKVVRFQPNPDDPWSGYFRSPSVANFRRLLARIAVTELGLTAPAGVPTDAAALAPLEYPVQAIYHPDAPAPGFFPTLADYETWIRRHRPVEDAPPAVGISFHRSFFLRENVGHIDALIRAIEARGARAVALMSQGAPDYAAIRHADGTPAIDVLLFIGERISIARKGDGIDQLRALGVPVLSTFQHFSQTPAEYRASPGGLAPSLTGVITDHERDGLFEPLLVAGKGSGGQPGRTPTAVLPEQIGWRVDRALAWARLRRLDNGTKNLVFTYWSEGAGKANVGGDPDDFLDVPGSVAALLPVLRARGYDVGPDPLPSRDQLSDRMSREASNIGTWAPGELAARVRSGAVALLPAETYQRWFDALPESRREEIIRTWGPAPGRIMVHTDETGRKFLVIPRLQFGRVTVAAHPDWGYLQDDTVLVSKDAIPPHHQYLAFFLWMQREARADAWVSLFSNIVLQPAKSEGPVADDHVAILLGAVPHIHPEKLGGNGGISNKRKALALTPGWFNAVVPSDALVQLGELAARLRRYHGNADPAARADALLAVREEATRRDLARELGLDPAIAPEAEFIPTLQRHLAKLERDNMPNGSHVIGEPPSEPAAWDMVGLMLRPDLRPLLPADTTDADYRAAIASFGRADESPAVRTAVRAALEPQRARILEAFAQVRSSPREVEAILAALEGRWIPPGPFDEPLRQPAALPPGRNLYGFDQRIIPTPEAEISGRRQAEQLIAQHREKHAGAYPEKLAYVLWSSGIAKTGGASEAAVLHLLGTRVTRDERGNVTGVELIPREELGRPRIDVLMTTSGTYRDHFQDKIDLITAAVRLAAASPEADNPVAAAVAARSRELQAQGESDERVRQLATARVFSPAPGAYSPGTQFLAKAGDARGSDDAIADLYLRRLGHAYGGGLYGEAQRPLFERNLANVAAATLPRPGQVNGILDNPMPAAFLGGLGQAVRRVSGREADLFTTDVRDAANPGLETVAASISRELRSRYFNPKFIEALKARGYDGARYPMFLAEHLDLWDTTTPSAVQSSDWAKLKQVYVDDEYGLGLNEFFQRHNPFARQMILANLLQASARGHWEASRADLAQLAQALAESARDNGLVCEANLCRNQALTTLVADSLTGVPGAEALVAAYRGALERVQSIPAALAAAPAPGATSASVAAAAPAPTAAAPAADVPPPIEGRVLEEKTLTRPPEPTGSAAGAFPWLWTGLAALGLALFAYGWSRHPA